MLILGFLDILHKGAYTFTRKTCQTICNEPLHDQRKNPIVFFRIATPGGYVRTVCERFVAYPKHLPNHVRRWYDS